MNLIMYLRSKQVYLQIILLKYSPVLYLSIFSLTRHVFGEVDKSIREHLRY